jgi:hypothetical protein
MLRPVNENDAISLEDINASTYRTLRLLDEVLSTPSEKGEQATSSLPETAPGTAADLAHALHHLVAVKLPVHMNAVTSQVEELAKPGIFTRTWPVLLGVPVGVVFIGRTAYNSRDTIYRFVVAL